MAEGRMPEIVPQRDGLRQILVHAQRPGNGPCNLRYFQGMGKARPVVIAFRRQKYLRLMLQPAKCLTVDNPVPVTLIDGPYITRFFLPFPSSRIPAE